MSTRVTAAATEGRPFLHSDVPQYEITSYCISLFPTPALRDPQMVHVFASSQIFTWSWEGAKYGLSRKHCCIWILHSRPYAMEGLSSSIHVRVLHACLISCSRGSSAGLWVGKVQLPSSNLMHQCSLHAFQHDSGVTAVPSIFTLQVTGLLQSHCCPHSARQSPYWPGAQFDLQRGLHCMMPHPVLYDGVKVHTGSMIFIVPFC